MKTIQTKDRITIEEPSLDAMIGYNLRRAAAVMLLDFELEFAKEGLRPTTFGMLAVIDERPSISPAELGRVLGIKSANMAPLVAELEARGFVERRPHPDDKRVHFLFLTDNTKSLMPELRRKAFRHEGRVLYQLNGKERLTFLSMLQRIWNE